MSRDGLFGLGPEPDFIVDIGPVAARKAAAFAMHTSQGASLAVEDLAAWARVRALQTLEPHVRLAEAFSAASRASLARAGVILASLNSCTDN